MILWQASLDDLRRRAEQCLAHESPTPSQARELALGVLSLLSILEASAAGSQEALARSDGGHPYRAPAIVAVKGPLGGPEDAIALAALERALEETRSRLAAALAELASRKDAGSR